ncbi:g3635 [Coccomyxa viridis]|uniref:G3635 protein n=1 Tax=Coccomyxa viridis TaxID=1274662 RepID=A0ABP1FSA3_9CHLO
MNAEAKQALQVLFCGEEFTWGFKFSKEALDAEPDIEVRQCRREDVAANIGTAHMAVPLMSRLDADMLAKAHNLKVILQYGVGVEGIDIPTATLRGIHVSNIPSEGTGNALSCAEMAVYLTLACLRSAPSMADSIQHCRVGVPLGKTLFGKRVLVVGFGGIAKELIPRLKPFGVHVTAVRRSGWGQAGDAAAESLLDAKASWSEMPSLTPEADVIIVACSQDATTRGFVNSAFLSACKAGVVIVNVARGGLLDYESVKEGLQSGQIGHLGLDVQWVEPFDPQDWIAQHPRVVLTPHVAGVTELSYRKMAQIVAAEARRMRDGLPPTILLNGVKS